VIVTRTPFRVTLGGGGTDLPSYFREHGGFIFAMGINKYVYIAVNEPAMGEKIRLHYSDSEVVDDVADLRHGLAREALRLHGIERRFEIASIADLPAGTGLGSSSCYLVGLLNALHSFRRDHVPLQHIAEEACHIELEILREPIGKQDQYMATFGGLTVLEIAPSGDVAVRQLDLPSGSIAEFVSRTHLYYTGTQRATGEVLAGQNQAMQSRNAPNHQTVAGSLHAIKELGYRILDAIERGDLDRWGLLLHEHWENKKRLSDKISLEKVDQIYEQVRSNHNVLGGKIIGAGGGGFLMLYCDRDPQGLERFMERNGMPRMHFTIEPEGSKVIVQFGSGAGLAVGSPRSFRSFPGAVR
jgi:D-glycero-alpha-D-manno-heptose-7-phosphate kinase